MERRQQVITVFRIYVYWARQWLLLIEIKITVITATFGLTASPPPATSETTSATSSVSTGSTARKASRDVVSQLKLHIFK